MLEFICWYLPFFWSMCLQITCIQKSTPTFGTRFLERIGEVHSLRHCFNLAPSGLLFFSNSNSIAGQHHLSLNFFLPNHMKTPYQNIYNVLRLNRFIVLAVVIGAVLTCTISVIMVIKLHKESVNNAFVVNSNGSVIPLKMVQQNENLEVEVLSHLEQFHTYFYHIDASNYEKNLEKALWLGNSSVDALYRQKKADGVYNRLLQYSLV